VRKVRIDEVAADAGVSRATVDRVLNRRGGVSMDKERAVLKSARALGLDRNLKAPPIKAIRVCVLMPHGNNPFYERLSRGFREANLVFADRGITAYINHIDVLAPESIQQRLRRIGSAYDAVVIVAPVNEKTLGLLRPLAARIPVVTLASDLPLNTPHPYVGPSNYQAGRLAGELMGRLLGEKGGGIIFVTGLQDFSGHRERKAGFHSVLLEDFPNCRIAVEMESQDQGALVAGAVATALARDPEIRGLYNISQGNDEIARRIKELRATRFLVFICHDLTPVTRDLLLSREIDVIIDQDPILEARRAMELVLQHYGRLEDDRIGGSTPLRVIFRENAAGEAG
jgi:LacI family transcriptional regulator